MMIERFHMAGKYPILRHPFIMRVSRRIAFFGRFLCAAFEIESFPGAFFRGSCLRIFSTVPGVVNVLFVAGVEFKIWMLFITSGRSGPGFSENWVLYVFASSSALSLAEYARPSGSIKG